MGPAAGGRRGRHRAAVGVLALSLAMLGALVTPAGAVEPDEVRRVGGATRYATAEAVARELHPRGATTVYLATGATFPDALSAAAAAAADRAPLLLTHPDRLSTDVAGVGAERVVVVGGPDAISDTVVRALGGLAHTRLAGADRYATAVQVANRTGAAASDTVVIATGEDHPDALAGAVLAGDLGAPLLLATADGVPEATAAELRRRQPRRVVVVGGPQALGPEVVAAVAALVEGVEIERLAGADRFATAVAVAEATTAPATGAAVMAAGRDFPDALAAAPAAAARGVPLLLTDTACQPRPTFDATVRWGVTDVMLVGGVQAVRRPAALPIACGPVVEETIASGLEVPWGVAFTPEGAYVSERDSGRVLLLGADGAVDEVQRLDIDPAGEGGLLGLAASPQYATDGLLYAYRTTRAGNEVVRFRPGGPPTVVIDGIPSGRNHNGGRIGFGADGMLYITTGDAGTPALAPDPTSLAGKVLRVDPDGGVPADNPDPTSPVYSSGHRNVEGLAFRAVDDTQVIYAAEFGPDRDDEINEIRPGGDYGWPSVTGRAGAPGSIDPIFVRQPPEASWSGIAYLEDSSTDWDGHLVAAGLRGQRLWRLPITLADTPAAASYVGAYGRLRTAVQAPDGSLWLLTSNTDGRGSPGPDDDRIIRVGRPRLQD